MKERIPARTFEDLVVWQRSHALEGFKRGRSDKARLLNMAQTSLEELRYYFILATDLGYAKERESEVLDEIARMLGAYTQSLLSPAS